MSSSAINYTGSAGGRIVQVVNSEYTSTTTTTNAIPADTTKPLFTEGLTFMTRSITPTNASNLLLIEVNVNAAASAASAIVAALFQDASGSDECIASSVSLASSNMTNVTLRYYMTAGTTNATTFQVNIGGNTGTITINGFSATNYYGSSLVSSITITEIGPGTGGGAGGSAITGEPKMWLTDTAPDGYLLCDGSAVSQTTYADLYAVIGVTFGDPGGGEFNLPDMRGRMPLGKDNMGGVSADRVTSAQADTVGGAAGAEDGWAAHTHPVGRTGAHSSGTQLQRATVEAGQEPASYSNMNGTQATSSGTADGNMTPYLTVNYIIKT